MRSSEQVDALFAALAQCQGELSDPIKDKSNPAYKSKYADLAAVLQTIRPTLCKFGLGITQGVETAGDLSAVLVTTRLFHKSGQWIESTVSVPITKKDAQGLGSATSYGRRYGVNAIVSIAADDDDDGNAAVGLKKDKAQPREAQEAPAGDLTAVIAAFAEIKGPEDKAKLMALIPAFNKLSPAEQVKVQPVAAEARKRVGVS